MRIRVKLEQEVSIFNSRLFWTNKIHGKPKNREHAPLKH